MSHVWNVGQWCSYLSDVYLVVDVNERADSILLFRLRSSEWVHKDECLFLPDCIGWDWQPPKPIEPPEGYRLLSQSEVIEANDLTLTMDWLPVWSEHVGRTFDPVRFTPIARKIEPKYRPFKDAAEFSSHRDKWVRWKRDDPHMMRIGSFNNVTAWPACASVGTGFTLAFEKWEFEDGTPFGVLDQ